MDEENRQLHNELNRPADTKGRIITIVVLVLVLVTIWFMLDLAIVTFVLTFVFYHLVKYAQRGLAKTKLPHIPDGVVLLVMYVVVIGLAVWFCVYYLPILAVQATSIAKSIGNFNFDSFLASLDPSLKSVAGLFDFNSYFAKLGELIMTGLASAGTSVLNLLLAVLLSFLLLIEKNKIKQIGKTVETSRISYIYRYFMLFGGSFCFTFGKVMRVQVLIAAINCGVSMIYLTITGFSYVPALGIMIFVLGLIPVAGVFISLIPLCIIAFNVGGLFKILEVLIMIAIIHCLEAYFLNPKLMSQRTYLPVSIVFIVLIVAQKYLGMWGLLIGVPVFIYLLAVLDIRYREGREADEAKAREAAKAAKAAKAQRRPNGSVHGK
jgi:predicted PurR-regulated permease PerM